MTHAPFDIIATLLRARLQASADGEQLSSDGKSHFMEVVDFAGRQGVSCALHGGLQALCANGQAEDWRPLLPMLKVLQDDNAKKNKQAKSVMLAANNALVEADITPVFLKGAAFILENTDNAPWRFISDIDLLVEEDQAAVAFDALTNAGFEPGGEASMYDPRFHHHIRPVLHRASGFAIEIHHRLMQPKHLNPIATKDIIATAQMLQIADAQIAIPNVNHRAFHLIAHAQISNMSYRLRKSDLKSLNDLAELSARPDFDWHAVNNLFLSINRTEFASGFLALAQSALSLKSISDLPASAEGRVWAEHVLREITIPPGKVKRMARLAKSYIANFTDNPARIMMLFQSLSEKHFRQSLKNTSQKRIQ